MTYSVVHDFFHQQYHTSSCHSKQTREWTEHLVFSLDFFRLTEVFRIFLGLSMNLHLPQLVYMYAQLQTFFGDCICRN